MNAKVQIQLPEQSIRFIQRFRYYQCLFTCI